MNNIEKRWPGMPSEVGRDINQFIDALDDDTRNNLWNAFVESYDYNTHPRLATFTKLMEKHGLRKREPQGVYVGFCKTCNVTFPHTVGDCPICGNQQTIMKVGVIPKNYIRMQSHCGSCQRFTPHGTTGAMCRFYGKDDFRLESERDQCKTCECKICCREARIFNNSTNVHRDMRIKGEFEGGYIPRRK